MTRTHPLNVHTALRLATTLAVVLACTTGQAAAQTDHPSRQPQEKKWSLTRGYYGIAGSPAPAIEEAMRQAGFDDPSVGWGAGEYLNHPLSFDPSIGSETELTYRFNRWLAVGVRRTSASLGETSGYQADYKWLTVDSQTTGFAPIVYFRLNRYLRVGAGPLQASTEVRHRTPSQTPTQSQTFKSAVTGGILTASLEGGITSHLAFAVSMSRLSIPSVMAGPFTTTSDLPSHQGDTATLPAMRVNLSHDTFGVSLGIRF